MESSLHRSEAVCKARAMAILLVSLHIRSGRLFSSCIFDRDEDGREG